MVERRNLQIERALNQEHMWRCRALGVLAIPVPNNIWIPARSEEERLIVARIINRMKTDGMLMPNAPDLCLFARCETCGRTCGAVAELKRGAVRDLFRKLPAGRPSDGQKRFAEDCEAMGVSHTYSASWEETLAAMRRWGMVG